uniref:Disco interacting A n=1 Tax=Monodelphis domestica TaxID=13616 RepID=A0A5F8G9P7_MONDO
MHRWRQIGVIEAEPGVLLGVRPIGESQPCLAPRLRAGLAGPPALRRLDAHPARFLAGDITQKGYEKKRAKLLARYIPEQSAGVLADARCRLQAAQGPMAGRRVAVWTQGSASSLPRRSVLAHSSVETYTPPDTSSASEDEGSLRQQGRFASAPFPSHCGVEPWLHRAIQGSSTSSSNSSTSSHPGGKPAAASNTVPLGQYDNLLWTPATPGCPRDRTGALIRVPAHSRVSSKIQQLLNTLKRPKRPPLKEFFVDDFEELLEVHQPDPNQPKPEGSQMTVLRGEPLDVAPDGPPSLLAALQRWGTAQPKAPCLTALDTTGKAVYTLTYGKLWSRSVKLAYTLLHKLPSKSEPLLRPGDRVALVFPNSDPVMFMVAFYGCLLAELIPVPIEVPLTRKDAGSQQIGFLLGSCGVALALTTDACQKGLPKAPTGEVATFKGWPRLVWFVIDGKHLGKPSRDWQPPVRDAGAETAYIEYKTSKEDSTVGITVSHASVLAQCRALTQACAYSEAETLTNVLDFKRDAGLWHGVLTSVLNRMHVVSIPYALMKVNPLSWIQKVCSYKARVALVKSRDMHWSLLAQRDQRDVSLSSLRMLIVADGANPWSVSSCDAFLNVFQSRGLRADVICPCASSSEALTVAIRRPPDSGGPPPGKAVLSMSGLSYGVIRVDTEEKLSVLTVQDVGQVMPGANVCVVKVEGTPYLCRTDEVGEVCVRSGATGTAYYGLLGITKNVFETIPVTAGGVPISDQPFTRTGLLGFIGPVSAPGPARLCPLAPLPARAPARASLFLTCFSHHRHRAPPRSSLRGSRKSSCRKGLTSFHSQEEVEPASMIVGNLVAGKRIAQASGRDVTQLEDNDQARKFLYLADVLQWRAQTTPDHPLFLLLNAKGTVTSTATCVQLHKKAERVAAALTERGHLSVGDHVALVYPPGVDLIATFYGCLYAGCIPITVRPPHPQNLATTLPTVKMIVEVSLEKTLDSSRWEADAAVDPCRLVPSPSLCPLSSLPDDLPKKKVASVFRPPSPDMLAYLDFSVSTTGILAGVKMSHTATSALCRSIKLQCELYPSRQIAVCLDPYCGLGFALWCLCSVYSGHQSLLVPPLELENNVSLWLSAVSQYRVRVTFCSYSVMEMCTKGLGTQTDLLRAKSVNLSCVRTCMVVAEERPRIALTQSFSKLFKDLGLSARAVSTTFGCRVNVAICLQGTAGPDPTTVYVDMRALRHDRVRLVERGSPHSLPLMESGKILPGVKVIIAHTETKGPLGDSHLGEIWVSSPHNATGYYTVYGEESLHADHFSARLSFGDTQTIWARTGYLGFLRRTDLTDASGERHDALYVVGSLDETLELRGMRYHPIDIETSVIRAHKSIAECAVFTWTNLLVVVVELEGPEQEALDLVALVTNVILEEHFLIVGVVVIVDPGVIPINSRGEKQRMHLRDGFLADQLDPIYVAYNM